MAGSLDVLELYPEIDTSERRIDLNLCVLCQELKDSKGVKKLTSTENGRLKIFESSKVLADGLADILERRNAKDIKYHVKTCYPRYIRAKERAEQQKLIDKGKVDDEQAPDRSNDLVTPERKSKRQKLDITTSKQIEKPCIICNSIKRKGDNKRFRICENKRAKLFLSAIKFFKDDTFDRCSLLDTMGDVFAADVLYHNNCMSNYILKFQREVDQLMDIDDTSNDDSVEDVFNKVVENMNFNNKAFFLSVIRDKMNQCSKDLKMEWEVTNRGVKKLLIKKYGENIFFAYPKDKSKSQLFFSSSISIENLIETIRNNNPLKTCASLLQEEIENFDFNIDQSFKEADDLISSMEQFENESLPNWNRFFAYLFKTKRDEESFKRHSATVFQILYNIFHAGRKKAPLHVAVAQTIHNTCKSKILIQIMNRLGISISYEEMERIDNNIALSIVRNSAAGNVPIGKQIVSSNIIHGAMDNFDHEEDSKSGIKGSHDTVLVLFQNTSHNISNISTLPSNYENVRSRSSIPFSLPCQDLRDCKLFGQRGRIADDFQPSEDNIPVLTNIESRKRIIQWSLCRSSIISETSTSLPSYIATEGMLQRTRNQKTTICFTPILPYPATEYDSIYTCMKNFQNVLRQKCLEYGPLWADEGVYRIAKEIQLLKSDEFKDIFLGLGGFHTEKVLIACCGKYLEESGIDTVLVESNVFGVGVVKTVLMGSHYNRGKRGIMIIVEAMLQILLLQFFKECKAKGLEFTLYCKQAKILQRIIEVSKSDSRLIIEEWNKGERIMSEELWVHFQSFIEQGSLRSQLFKYWVQFLFKIAPVLQDMTKSFRESNWENYLSAFRRAIPLFFAFDRTHYKRWGPLFLDDCLKVPVIFPKLYEAFSAGDFVATQTSRSCSSIPLDQALEMQYNKPAKSHSGIIGVTKRKNAVTKWNLIRHEKEQYTRFLGKICNLNSSDEYSMHHEFSTSITASDHQDVCNVVEYILSQVNPFDCSQTNIINITNGKTVSCESAEFFINCLDLGELLYQKFKDERLVQKTKQLFDTIPKARASRPKVNNIDYKQQLQRDATSFARYIDYARVREYEIKEMLKYELTEVPHYLTKDGFLRKSAKSELAQEIKRKMTEQIPEQVPTSRTKTAFSFDFMSFCRKVPIKKVKLETYADLFSNLWNTFKFTANDAARIDIIFDVYLDYSIKQHERDRRSTHQSLEVNLTNPSQKLPVEMEKFWCLSTNKMQLQQMFIEWIVSSVNIPIPIYLGGTVKEDITSCIKLSGGNIYQQDQLKCTHEEADDRIIFHVNDAIKRDRFSRVVIASPDTDVFVNALYHFSKWIYFGLEELWIFSGKSGTKQGVPLHSIFDIMDTDVVEVLPAVHSLTGCDTTSKICSKRKALSIAGKSGHSLLSSFGNMPLSDEVLQKAEQFLLQCVSNNTKCRSFDELREEVFYKKSFRLDIEKLPPTTSSINLHIKRSYYQTHLWQNSINADVNANALDYGYEEDENSYLQPQLFELTNILPENFPFPCNCNKCSRNGVCKCRKLNIKCCKYCLCKSSEDCQNPY